ncbi:hypothetical protein JB92DRAFT_1289122 [Gautieria morchelliformis]|nr:hypothetical protein JB92DRAFT_1289122 [Gautieria morchelliformis]
MLLGGRAFCSATALTLIASGDVLPFLPSFFAYSLAFVHSLLLVDMLFVSRSGKGIRSVWCLARCCCIYLGWGGWDRKEGGSK